jgi:hypothetical protein
MQKEKFSVKTLKDGRLSKGEMDKTRGGDFCIVRCTGFVSSMIDDTKADWDAGVIGKFCTCKVKF